MAYFAQLDANNDVIQVIAVSNDDCLDDDGNESEAVGVAFCQNLLGSDTNWKQTSYNANIRKNYAGIGMYYDATRDAFIPHCPHASWSLNEQTCLWDAPVDYPDDGNYYSWDESIYQADTSDPKTAGWVLVE